MSAFVGKINIFKTDSSLIENEIPSRIVSLNGRDGVEGIDEPNHVNRLTGDILVLFDD